MKIVKYVLPVIAAGFVASSASAAISASNNVIDAGAVVENSWSVTTDTDFLSAVVYAELTSGTVWNPNSIVPGLETFQNGANDTFFSANGNPSVGIAGGAGDLEVTAPAAATVGPTILGVAWFSPGADSDDIGAGLPIGSFSFTSDANGTWALRTINAANDQENLNGLIVNGVMTVIPEPASLALMGLGGLAALRRRR
jgi:PEP-CTERM motif-containing protein